MTDGDMTERGHLFSGIAERVRMVMRNDQLILSLLSAVVGFLAGVGVVAFREGIDFFKRLGFGSDVELFYQYLGSLPWWHIVLVPTLGGLAVGILVHIGLPGARPHAVADVIEASAMKGANMSLTTGLRAAVVSAISLGVGASAGQEGPAVHLGASLGSWLSKHLKLARKLARTLLGCGVASAVAASFNAPIAGALFANEVVVGHYALSAFAPIVIASVTGTVVSQAWFGDYPAFIISDYSIASVWEFPAFVGLGIVSALVAVAFMRSIHVAEDVSRRLPVVSWLRPAIGGFIIGVAGVFLPQILGVGYGATEAALLVTFSLWLLIVIGIAKIAATAISIGFGFGGGVFSPSLVIGAMVGGAYGVIVTQIFPDLSSGIGAYTLVGMGSVAAAVLGAPISTTLIIFEMTGDYKITMAVMLSVVIASTITRQMYGPSFFAVQLERRGLDLKAGFEMTVLRSVRVRSVIADADAVTTPDVSLPAIRSLLQDARFGEVFVLREDNTLFGTITLADLSDTAFDHGMDVLIRAADVARMNPPLLYETDTLERALQVMRESDEEHIAVVQSEEDRTFLGCAHERDVMAAYSRELIKTRREEHGED